jgi:hypothetical protein
VGPKPPNGVDTGGVDPKPKLVVAGVELAPNKLGVAVAPKNEEPVDGGKVKEERAVPVEAGVEPKPNDVVDDCPNAGVEEAPNAGVVVVGASNGDPKVLPVVEGPNIEGVVEAGAENPNVEVV